MDSKVDEMLEKSSRWRYEMQILRKIILSCGLEETLKWGKPCYAYKHINILIIQPFKDYCALLFFKGVLLKDSDQILVKTGANTHVGRQFRFTDIHEVLEKEQNLKAYIFEAIEVEKAGLKVPVQHISEYEITEELLLKFEEIPSLETSFEALSPGRQKAYLIYFAKAKQSKTRLSRIEKYIPKILNGKGIND